MTAVARQVPITSGHPQAATVPSYHTPRANEFITSNGHGFPLAQGQGSQAHQPTTAQNGNGERNGNGKSPPPPPPPRTTSSRSAKVPVKEDVVLRNGTKQVQTAQDSGQQQQSSAERNLLSIFDARGNNQAEYSRQRLNMDSSGYSQAEEGKQPFSTVQWRGKARLNPYTAEQPIRSKFSSSQPHLNKIDQHLPVKPNDRIRKSMFDQDSGDEQADEDYGSGYMPNLMKISYGVIQKHTVAVTTPTVPMSRLNRSGSDPNMLETSLDAPRKTREGTKTKGATTANNNRRGRTSSLSAASGGSGSDALTTPIARAYREHLIEKMEKRKHSSSASPSPSDSSAESSTNHTLSGGGGGGGASGGGGGEGEGLSLKLRSISPSQLQGINVPDRAYYPRILPPPSVDKQDLSLVTKDNEVYPNNPFLLHSTVPPITPQSARYDTTDVGGGFSYGTLPRNTGSSGMNGIQSANIGYKGRTQSVNQLHSEAHAGNYQSDELSRSYSESSQLPVSMPSPQPKSQDFHGGKQWRNESLSYDSSTQSSAQQSSDNSQQLEHPRMMHDWRSRMNQPAMGSHDPRMTKHVINNQGCLNGQFPSWKGITTSNNNNKPPVLPKPSASRQNDNPLAPQRLAYHDRSTSDPALNYSHAPMNTMNPRLDSDAQLQQPPQQQGGRGKGGRPLHQHQHLTTSLLEIRESDEGDEREATKRKAGRQHGGVKLSEYVSLSSAQLPKRVRVSGGSCSGPSGVPMLSHGDETDLHFVRELKAALVVDSTKIHYTVPLNSLAKFSVIYDPFKAERVAKLGFQFKTAGAIIDLKKPPHVVAATQGFDGGSFESSVDAGEVLVLEGVRNVFHGRLLKAFSLRHNTTKFIDERCAGNFTTSPDKVKMSLAQIYNSHISLPLEVLLHPPPNSNLSSSIPASLNLRSEPVLLKRFAIHKSVIATTVSQEAALSVSKIPVISIPLGLDVSVQEVSVTERQLHSMRQRTQTLVDNFKGVSVTHYLDMPSSESHVAQCALFLNLDPKLEGEMLLDTAGSNSMQTKYRKDAKRMTTANPAVAKKPATQALDRKMESRIKALEGKYALLESKMVGASEQLARVSLKVDQVHTYLSKAQSAMSKQKHARNQSDAELEREDQSSRMSTGSTSGSSSISSRGSSYGRADSRQSLKNSSESVNVNGNDARTLNDDVFVTRPRSASSNSKPAILSKPKQLIRQRSSEVKVHAASGEGKLSRQLPVNSNSKKGVVSAKKGVAPAGNIKKGVASAKKGVVPEDIKKGVAPACDIKKGVVPSIGIKKAVIPVEEDIYDSLANYSSIGSKRDSDNNIENKPGISKSSGSQAGQLDILGMEFESADTMTDDLTDWCLQVEDELTQLYNESMLSVS